jgi:hypothetical protein
VCQLVRVVVATAALLGVLGLPTPVAAETAEQRQATLNAYRAKAGLAKASTTSIPALGVAPAGTPATGSTSTRATRSCCPSWACPTWACSGPT